MLRLETVARKRQQLIPWIPVGETLAELLRQLDVSDADFKSPYLPRDHSRQL